MLISTTTAKVRAASRSRHRKKVATAMVGTCRPTNYLQVMIPDTLEALPLRGRCRRNKAHRRNGFLLQRRGRACYDGPSWGKRTEGLNIHLSRRRRLCFVVGCVVRMVLVARWRGRGGAPW